MKLINKKNFISIVCISFTLIVCGKLLIEKIAGFTDRQALGSHRATSNMIYLQ